MDTLAQEALVLLMWAAFIFAFFACVVGVAILVCAVFWPTPPRRRRRKAEELFK